MVILSKPGWCVTWNAADQSFPKRFLHLSIVVKEVLLMSFNFAGGTASTVH